jgi:RNA polymerase sigma factor (TIGR02999 family)
MESSHQDIAELMGQFRQGSKEAAGRLVTLLYPELKSLARSHMSRERQGHSWQPTMLVNQLYMELVKIKALPADNTREGITERQSFFGLAAFLMRRALVRHSRLASSRTEKITLDDTDSDDSPRPDDLVVVESLLKGLEQVSPDLRAIVELKVLEELPMEQVAAQMDIPVRTAYRRWNFARTWLAHHASSQRTEK